MVHTEALNQRLDDKWIKENEWKRNYSQWFFGEWTRTRSKADNAQKSAKTFSCHPRLLSSIIIPLIITFSHFNFFFLWAVAVGRLQLFLFICLHICWFVCCFRLHRPAFGRIYSIKLNWLRVKHNCLMFRISFQSWSLLNGFNVGSITHDSILNRFGLVYACIRTFVPFSRLSLSCVCFAPLAFHFFFIFPSLSSCYSFFPLVHVLFVRRVSLHKHLQRFCSSSNAVVDGRVFFAKQPHRFKMINDI